MSGNKKTGAAIPELLLPSKNVNLKKWAVIACDQYTSQPEYWNQVDKIVGNSPSILHMILPEVYLNFEGLSDNIEHIKMAMQQYLKNGVLEQLPPGIVLVEREAGDVVRYGLMIAVDLESYDFNIKNKPQIRATEKTLLERIPPRVTIRQGAPLETSHVMLMMDDAPDKVIGPLCETKEKLVVLYNFELMMNGGRVKGYFVEDNTLLQNVLDAIAGLPLRDGMRFCVGDGNHSLATAKTVWDIAKSDISEEERENHPLRFALCELVNIHDKGIELKAIHRVLFKVNPVMCLQYIANKLNLRGIKSKTIFGRWRGGNEAESGLELPFLYRDSAGKIVFEKKPHPMIVGVVQDILEEYIKENPSSSLDYIHGQKAFEELSRAYDNLGLFFAPIAKDKFFDTVIKCGVLPKKCFSIGDAEQKRYYLECRRIVNTEIKEKITGE